jgi:hypothetical protein
MKRKRLSRGIALSLLTVGSALILGVAYAQPAAPAHSASAAPIAKAAASAKASAAPAASAAPSASASPSASPSASLASAPSDSPHGAMPPGHGANPHGGGASHGNRNERFQPAEDGAEETTDLPPGTILLMIADRDEVPVAGVPVTIAVLHSSVAKGDTREKFERVTDVAGMVKVDDLEVGSANSYRISAKVGEADFALRPIQLSEKGGKRALLHVYDAAEDLAAVEDKGPFGMETEVRTSLREDVLVVRDRVRLYNFTPVAWIADVEVPLPQGFKAFQTPDEASGSPVQILQTESGAVLRGTVPPGTTDLVFGYHIPRTGDSTQSFDVTMFPNTVGVGVVAEASKKMSLSAEGFSQPQFTKDEEGLSVLVAARQASAETGPVQHFKVTLNGLPTRGSGGYIAALLALIALATAGAYRWSRRGRTDLEPDTMRDLIEAKETLIKEIAALETAYKRGMVGPQTYERSRGLLLDALARIVARLEGPVAPTPPEPTPAFEATDAG